MKLSHVPSPEMLKVFETIPGKYLIVSPEMKILTASNTYLNSLRAERETLVGKSIRTLFSQLAGRYETNSSQAIYASLEEVLRTREPHQMPLARYYARHPVYSEQLIELKGRFSHTPVFDEAGQVSYVIQELLSDPLPASPVREAVNTESAQVPWSDSLGHLTHLFSPAGPFQTILDVSLTAINLLTPVYDSAGNELVDFAIEYINPAGQRMLGLPERPGGTLLSRFPHTQATQIFTFYQRVFLSGEAGRYDLNYQYDGLDNYFCLSAQRNGQVLVVSFTDTSNHDRSVVEQALRESQAREKEARTYAELQWEALKRIFEQVPVAISILRGPQFIVELANSTICTLWGRSLEEILGKPRFDIQPELREQGVEQLMMNVMRTEVPFVGTELEIQLMRNGRRENAYFNFAYQPLRNGQGLVDGIIVMGVEVTEQVVSRKKVEQSEEKLQELNQQLKHTILDLESAQASVQQARAEADLQRRRLQNIFMQAPAMICIFEGPTHLFKLVNPPYQRLVGERSLVGKPIAEAMPELAGQPIFDLLDEVYRTGESFRAHEMLVQLDHDNAGELGKNYYNFIYQATRGLAGDIDGILVFAYEVTAQVQARQEVQALNEELAASNEELVQAKQALEQMNSELEERVVRKTKQVTLAQFEAQRQQERLERFFMQAPAAICILDGPDLVYELVNPAYQQLFPGRQLKDKPLLEALPELTGHIVWHTLQKVYQTGITHEERDILIPMARYEGAPLENIYFNYIQQARYDEGGQIDGVLVFAFEVTQQVLARQRAERSEKEAQALTEELMAANEEIQSNNEELSTTNGQLLRTNTDLDNFIYTASHDLKAPISNIEGLMQALLRSLPTDVLASERIARIAAMTQESIERFKRTIAKLTEVVKLQKESDGDVAAVDLPKIIREVMLDLEPLMESSKAQVVIELERCPAVSFSEKNLRSVVYNLLSNALKYRALDRPLQVRIHCEQTPDYSVLVVADNGLGIPSKRLGQLFTMFKRFHDHVEGSGIGLYMVKKMVENAGGKIEVESEAGLGTTFKVYFRHE